MTTQNLALCKVAHWKIDAGNVGHCEHFENKVCKLSHEVCAEKGKRDYNVIQKGLYNKYGEITVKFGGQYKIKSEELPPDVRFGIRDIVYGRNR